MFLSLKLIVGHEWKPHDYFWGISLGVVYPIFTFLFICVCVFIRSTIELTYLHTQKPGWHMPVDKLKQPHIDAKPESRVYKQVHPQTDNNNKKCYSFFFLCFLLLYSAKGNAPGGGGVGQALCNKNTTKPWPRKSTTKRCCCATPWMRGCFLLGSHQESRHEWPF